jgi:zinc and cadmium transporter
LLARTVVPAYVVKGQNLWSCTPALTPSVSLILFAVGASSFVSVAAGVGASIPLFRRRWIAGRLPAAASFAAGVLIGDAFLHLLPGSLQQGLSASYLGLWLITGVLIFFSIECILRLAPRMMATARGDKQAFVIARMDIVGDVVHHAMDGLLIGGAFLAGVAVGMMTAAAIASHEVVRKFGVAGVLLMSGMRPKKALVIVWLNTLVCPLTACLLLTLAREPRMLAPMLAPILAAAAGGAVYLACSDFLPAAWQASGINPTPGIAGGFGLGIFVIWLCEAIERGTPVV